MRYFLNVLFVLAILPAMPLGAAPIQYQVNMTVPTYALHPLGGANLRFDVKWDHASLSPIDSIFVPGRYVHTMWPSTNSQGSVTVSGLGSVDGVYPVSFDTEWNKKWLVGDYSDSRDQVRFPIMSIDVGGIQLRIDSLTILYKSIEFGNVSPVYPKSFTTDSVIMGGAVLLSSTHPEMKVYRVDAFSVVPEPAALGLCLCSGIWVLLSRCRK